MSKHSKYQSSGSAGIAILLTLIGFVLVIAPFVANSFLPENLSLSGIAVVILSIFGAALLLVGIALLVMTKLYIKPPANEALVITGMSKKTIIDGGTIYIPMFMDLMPVPLETMKLVVRKIDNEAFLTKDKLKADISSEFFIKIPKDIGKINIAATSLGREGGITTDTVLELVNDKLISALRDAVAKKTLEELHSDRASFAQEVADSVTDALAQNGLELESVTISSLDQSNYDNIDTKNVFNAQGAKNSAKIIEVALKDTEQIKLDNKLAIDKMRVETEKKLNEQKIDEETSNADREKKVIIVKATADKDARTESAKMEEEAQVAEVKRDEAIDVANINKEKVTAEAKIEKDKDLAVKAEEKLKAHKIAEIEKDIAIADKEKDEAEAQAKTNKALALAKKEEESVKTVSVEETAKRNKIQKVIAKSAEAEEAKIMANNAADIEAYEIEKKAEADKKSALDKAEAIRKVADANKDAAIFKAEGEEAVAMIPVKVNAEQVKVEASRVLVLQDELKAKAEFEGVSVTLTTNLAQIDANKEVQKAFAAAMGDALSNTDIKIFGDNDTMKQVFSQFIEGTKKAQFLNTFQETLDLGEEDSNVGENLLKQYLSGQETAMLTEGFVENLPEELSNLIETAGGTLASLIPIATKLLGQKPKGEILDRLKKLASDG